LNFARYERSRQIRHVLLAWLTPAVLLVIWEVAARHGAIDVRLFPAPSSIWGEAKTMARDGSLWHNVWVSSRRTLIGFALGAVAGAVVGVIMGLSSAVRASLELTLSALYVVPKISLLPFLLLVFGIGETPKVLLVAITVFFFMWISTMGAVASVNPALLECVRSFGAGRLAVVKRVVVPASLPQMFTGLRLSAGVAILVMVSTEFVQGNDGIGKLIWQSWTLFLATRMYVGIVSVAIMGVVFTSAVKLLARLVVPWARLDGNIDVV
jgi:NitT/TauT family transport system permease protein/sulfonate transport system permease protein